MHRIEDEIIFANHKGYVFHDSRGFECGSEEELRIVQDFVHTRMQKRRLVDRIHAIWFALIDVHEEELLKPCLQVLHSNGQ